MMIDMFQRRTNTGESNRVSKRVTYSMSPTAGMVILIALMALARLSFGN